jgi:hypothetical protein
MFKGGKNHTLIVSMNFIVFISCFNVFKFLIYFIFVDLTIRLVIGDGSDEVPFCLSMTSKMLLSAMNKLSMWELPVVLLMDGMFRLNESRCAGWCSAIAHIMSLSIILHHTKSMYLRVVQGFKDIISDLFPGGPFLPNYLMTDAEHTERIALVSVFPEADALMCFFHVIKASKDILSGNKDRGVILKDITLLHMSLSQQELDHNWTCAFNHWIVNSNSFAVYFQRQWVEGCFNMKKAPHSQCNNDKK